MASSKRISYHWRVFLPTVICLWLAIGCMAWWQYYRVKQTRTDLVFDQLRFLTEQVASIKDIDALMPSYIMYINRYYKSNEDYDEVTIITYDKTGNDSTTVNNQSLTYLTGPTVIVPQNVLNTHMGMFKAHINGDKSRPKREYLYYCHDNYNHTQDVISILPLTRKVSQSVAPVTWQFWSIIIIIGVFVTMLAYISTKYIVSNIRFLRNFTRRAARHEDLDVSAADNLPNDELGDISRDIISIYAQLTDEIKHSEQEHKVAIAAIEEKTRVKRILTANINHEIRTPIGIIKGYIDTILSDPEMPEDIKQKFLKKIQLNVNRLTELIANVAVITKYEHGENVVSLSEINFHDLVYTFADELKIADKGKNVLPFTFDVPLKCNVLGNEALFRSLLSNLLRNSRLHSQGSMCRLQYEREDEKFYYFSFYDDGVGVPPEALPRLFERFFRVNEGRERSSGGSGLGLPIVKVAIESFGGSIEVKNREPSGLIYHFSLVKYNSPDKIIHNTSGHKP